jgi:ArsR family transcriptional regulator
LHQRELGPPVFAAGLTSPRIQIYRISSIYDGDPISARRIPLDIRWTPKPEAADQLEAEMARLSKALGHPARVRILREVLTREICTCGQLTSALPLAQSTISQHLKVLKETAFLEVDASAIPAGYRLNRETLARYRSLVTTLTSPS